MREPPVQYLLKIRTSGNRTNGDLTSGGPPVPVNDFLRLAKKQQNCSNPTAVVLTMVLSFTMHLKGTGHYGFV